MAVRGNMLNTVLKSQRSSRITVRKDWDDDLHPRGWHGRWVLSHTGKRALVAFDREGRHVGLDQVRTLAPHEARGLAQEADRAGGPFGDLDAAASNVRAQIGRHSDDITQVRSRANTNRLMNEMGLHGVPRSAPEPEAGVREDRARLGLHTDDDGLTQLQRDYRDDLAEAKGSVEVGQSPLRFDHIAMTTPEGDTHHVSPDGVSSRIDRHGDS